MLKNLNSPIKEISVIKTAVYLIKKTENLAKSFFSLIYDINKRPNMVRKPIFLRSLIAKSW